MIKLADDIEKTRKAIREYGERRRELGINEQEPRFFEAKWKSTARVPRWDRELASLQCDCGVTLFSCRWAPTATR